MEIPALAWQDHFGKLQFADEPTSSWWVNVDREEFAKRQRERQAIMPRTKLGHQTRLTYFMEGQRHDPFWTRTRHPYPVRFDPEVRCFFDEETEW